MVGWSHVFLVPLELLWRFTSLRARGLCLLTAQITHPRGTPCPGSRVELQGKTLPLALLITTDMPMAPSLCQALDKLATFHQVTAPLLTLHILTSCNPCYGGASEIHPSVLPEALLGGHGHCHI